MAMTDIVVCGIEHHRKWMLHVVSCDCATGVREDFMWFFNTRKEAETHCERLASCKASKNMIIKIIKVRAFEHIGLDFDQIEKEN